jgi:hypothetical protein
MGSSERVNLVPAFIALTTHRSGRRQRGAK